MATTSASPISIPQINNEYYVGEPMLRTIQQAVTYAIADSNAGNVIISQAYTGTDSIATVTGGSPTVFIVDERNGQRQVYYWTGANYAAAAFVQDAGFIAEGMPPAVPASIQMGYAPAGDAGNGSGNIVIVSNPGDGIPSFNIILEPQGGPNPGSTFIRCALDSTGLPRVESKRLEVYPDPNYPDTFNMWIGQFPELAGNKAMYIWGHPSENAVDVQGVTSTGVTSTPTYDQTIRLNYLGGDVNIGMNASVTEDGELTAATINAGDAIFASCLVDESPVRTFANTPDTGPGDGMLWPDVGIAVSLGSSWQSPSIDPATIAYLGTPNWFTAPQTVNDDLTVWGLLLTSRDSAAGMNTGTQQGCFFTWNISNADGETDFVNNNTGSVGGFRWYNAPPSTMIDSTTEPLMILDENGGFLVHGTYSYLQAGDGVGPTGNQGVAGSPVARLVASVAGQDTISWPGQFQFNTYSATTLTTSADDTMEIRHFSAGPDGYSSPLWSINRAGNMFVANSITTAANELRLGVRSSGGWSTGSPNINSDGASLILNSTAPAGSVFFNYDQGSAVVFGNGAGGFAGSVDVAGNADFIGTLTAGVKSFRIPHPLDDTKYLTHSCIEGPEIAVYYRGETVTANGQTEVILPDYFEALTTPTDRSVLLTQIFEDDSEAIIGSNTFSMLMASRVKDGKFKIRSSEPIAKVWWEVKAVRRDVEPLVKETRRDAYARPHPTPEGPGDVRSGTPEAGEPKPKAVRAGTPTPAGTGRTRKPR